MASPRSVCPQIRTSSSMNEEAAINAAHREVGPNNAANRARNQRRFNAQHEWPEETPKERQERQGANRVRQSVGDLERTRLRQEDDPATSPTTRRLGGMPTLRQPQSGGSSPVASAAVLDGEMVYCLITW
jgi:hypothetical protein